MPEPSTPKRHLKARVEQIKWKDLYVDEATQRQLGKAKVRDLVKKWNADKVGLVTVSRREDGRNYIVNGMHRWTAALELGLHEQTARCDVYQNAGVADEARQFLALSDAKPIGALDKFRIGITAQDSTVLGVQSVLDDIGLRASSQFSDGHIKCVDRLLKIYREDPELLREVLQTSLEAWGTTPAAVESMMLAGLQKVLATYNGDLDRGVLVKKLKKYPGGPGALVGNAKGLSKIRPISGQRAVAEIIRDTYNKGRRDELPAL